MTTKTMLILAGAATAVLLLIDQTTGGGDDDDDPDSNPTAGDDNANIIEDGAQSIMSMFGSTWPIRSGPYQDTITAAANQYGVPVPILAWLLWEESRYRDDVISGATVSRVGAMGIAQFMPATAVQYLGSTAAALDPAQAIPGAAHMLADLYRSAGTWAGALAAYNWGIGNVMRKGLDAAPNETVKYYSDILNNAGMGATV